MASSETGDISSAIAPHLPHLRRFARALTGGQATGDGYAAAALEAIIADPGSIASSPDSKVALFRIFHGIWSSAGSHVEGPGRSEGPLAAKAQERLRTLAPATRVAVLLESLESFDVPAVAEIMQVPADEAADLIAAGWREIDRQVAGHVLIVEDEPVIAMDLKAIVSSLGHNVVGVSATRGEAVEMALARKPNLVLADVQLADGSSGIDAVRDIRAAFETPVIFITAYPERLLTGQQPEPTFIVTKPFREAQVRAAIGQALFFGTVADL